MVRSLFPGLRLHQRHRASSPRKHPLPHRHHPDFRADDGLLEAQSGVAQGPWDPNAAAQRRDDVDRDDRRRGSVHLFECLGRGWRAFPPAASHRHDSVLHLHVCCPAPDDGSGRGGGRTGKGYSAPAGVPRAAGVFGTGGHPWRDEPAIVGVLRRVPPLRGCVRVGNHPVDPGAHFVTYFAWRQSGFRAGFSVSESAGSKDGSTP